MQQIVRNDNYITHFILLGEQFPGQPLIAMVLLFLQQNKTPGLNITRERRSGAKGKMRPFNHNAPLRGNKPSAGSSGSGEMPFFSFSL